MISKYKFLAKEEPPKLTPQQLKEWNGYVDWLEKKGMKGSKDLDKGQRGLQVFESYLKENPSVSLKKEHIVQVQKEIEDIAKNARSFAERRNDPNAKNIMQGTSSFDGIPGSKTTSFKFPDMRVVGYKNDAFVLGENLGLLGGDMKPTGSPSVSLFGSKIPKGVNIEKLQDGYYYEDPQSGDLVKVKDL